MHLSNLGTILTVGTLHSQPFTTSSIHFLVIVESMATSAASGTKQIVVQRGKVRAKRWTVEKLSVEGPYEPSCPAYAALGRMVVLKISTSRQVSKCECHAVTTSRSLAFPLHTNCFVLGYTLVWSPFSVNSKNSFFPPLNRWRRERTILKRKFLCWSVRHPNLAWIFPHVECCVVRWTSSVQRIDLQLCLVRFH